MVEIHEWYIWIVSCQLPPSKCGVYKWWVCMFEDIAQMFLLYFLIANCVYGRLCPWHLFSFGVNWRWIILQGLLIIWEKKKSHGCWNLKVWSIGSHTKELQNAWGCIFWLEWTSIRWGDLLRSSIKRASITRCSKLRFEGFLFVYM